MNAAIYINARIEQHESKKIDITKKKLHEFAVKKGFTIHDFYVCSDANLAEDSESHFLNEDIYEGNVDVIIAKNLPTILDNKLIVSTITELNDKKKIHVVTKDGSTNTLKGDRDEFITYIRTYHSNAPMIFKEKMLESGFTQEELELFPNKWEKECCKGTYTIKDLKHLFVDLIYIDKYFSNPKFDSVVPSTIKTHKVSLIIFSEWLLRIGKDIKSFAQMDVQNFLEYRSKNEVSATTVNKDFQTIKNFCYWAGKREMIDDIKPISLDKSEKEKPPETLNKNEINEMLRRVQSDGNLRDIAIIKTLLYTGISLKEIQLLDRDDIEISDKKGYLYIRNGKGKKERNVPLNKEARKALARYLELRKDNKKALFLSNKSGKERVSVRTVQKVVRDYGSNPQKLRDTFIAALVNSGRNLLLVASLTGHDSVEMLNRYLQLTDEDREEAVEDIYNDKV